MNADVLSIFDYKPEILSITDVFTNFNEEAYSENTCKALKQAWNLFEGDCMSKGVKSLPASSETVVEYLKSRSNSSHRNTLKSDFWAIGKVHELNSLPSPTETLKVKKCLKGLVKTKVMKEEVIKQADAANWEDIREKIVELNKSDRVLDVRNASILALSYAGLLRSSELSGVKIKHLNLDHENPYVILPYTKTNKTGVADQVSIPAIVAQMIKKYLSLRKEVMTEEEYLFNPVTRHNSTTKHKTELSYRAILDIYKNIEVKGKSLSTHSCRVGAAQDMWKVGVESNKIVKLGRWSNEARAAQYACGYNQDSTTMTEMMK
ncbi:integrase/recombinase [Vibrio phage 1.084.O._10N.261.49.F5]|nr:integrase/recombinase [Vibrio phage 1.084.O._10N.261.49.F5]